MSTENLSQKKCGWDNQSIREKRINSLKESWSDPERKAYRISRTHSSEAQAKRSNSLKIWFAQNPVEAYQRMDAAHNALREKAVLTMRARLGDDPEKVLREAAEQALSTKEIAKKFGISVFTTQNYLNKFGIKLIRVTHLSAEETARRKDIYYWADTFGLVQNLPNNYPSIINRLYGAGREKIALETVAQEFSLTRERIRQIDAKSRRILETNINIMSFLS